MADLGAVAVRIGADISGLQRGLSDASGRLSAFEKDGEGVAARIKNSFSSLSGVVTAALAGVSIGSAFRSFIQNTIDAQNEQAQLAAVLQSTGNAAGYSQQKLNEMAEAMAKASTFDSGEINIAQTRLLSYTGVVGDSFPRAMQNAIDMATRMGMSVSQAAETVGRALDIPSQGLTALTKQGFRFTEAQKDLVKQLEETGKTAEAQAIIMEAMESSYKGAAAAAQNTLGGAIKNLQNAIKDTLTGGDQSVNGLTEAINDLASEMNSPEMKAGFGAIMSGLVNVASYAVSAFSKLTTFGRVLGEVIASKIHGSDSPSGRLREEADALEKEAARLNSNKVVPLIGRAFGSGDKKALEALKKAAALRQQAFEYDRDFKEKLPEAEPTNFKPDLPVAVTLPGGGAGSDKKKSAKESRDRAEEELKRQMEAAQRELEGVQKFLATKGEIEAQAASERIDALARARELGLITEKQYQDAELGVLQKHSEAVAEMDNAQYAKEEEKLKQRQELGLITAEDYFKRQLEMAAAHFETQREIEDERYQMQMDTLEEQRENELIDQETFNAMKEAIEQGHQDRIAEIVAEGEAKKKAIKDAAAKAEISTTQALIDTLGAIGAAGSRAAFNMHKVASISMALVKGKEAVVNAFNEGTRTGGFKKGIVMAGLAAATVAQQIAAIRSTSFGGGGGSASAAGGGGGGGSVSAAPEAAAPPEEAAKQTVTIALQGEVFGAKQVRELIEKINDATKNGAILNMV